MPNKTFIILGPDGDDGVPMHWNRETWGWGESAAPSFLTLYANTEVFSFPPRELPVGMVSIMNTATGVMYHPLTPLGPWDSEDKI